MKKLLLSITAILAVGFINAQIYSANDTTAFSAWNTYDADGDGYNWFNFDLTGFGSGIDAQGGVFLSLSYDTSALTPNNLAITPAINCSSNSSVFANWAAGSLATTADGYFVEHYAVYVVTNPAMLLSGNYPTPIWEGDLTAGDVMQAQSIDISSIAANQSSVYLVFRHFDCTDQWTLILDDVSLTAGAPVGVEEISTVASVYPNPTNSILNVKTSGEATSISIISMDGKVVATSAINGLTGSVNVAELVNGVYFYEVAAADGSVVRNTFVKN
jgi:hypothetical protein